MRLRKPDFPLSMSKWSRGAILVYMSGEGRCCTGALVAWHLRLRLCGYLSVKVIGGGGELEMRAIGQG